MLVGFDTDSRAALIAHCVPLRPTAAAYLGRVTKERILEAVREAKGEHAAERIVGLKAPPGYS